jgi:glycine cleavage system H lipoate-binding protein
MVLLLAILTLAMFVGGGIFLGWRQRRLAQALTRNEATDGIYFHPGHMWANFQPTGIAKVGIDRFLRGIVGRFEGLVLPSSGRYVKQGQVIVSVGAGERRIDLVSPLDGVVCAANARPVEGAEHAYRDDYLLLIRPTRLAANLAAMKGYREEEGWFRSEVARFKDFITLRMGNLREVGATLADGGEHTDGIVEKMDEATLHAFTEAFLR